MTDAIHESYSYCQLLAQKTAGNFYYSFLTLPREQFRSMCVLYSFMRITDDLGDSDEHLTIRAQKLHDWRENLKAALAGTQMNHPIFPAVADMVARYRLPSEHLEAVITGVEMDLGPVNFETFEELKNYCYHVAGAVGLACIHLWGFTDPRALDLAVDCGMAFQMTNILRDLGEDYARGRVYLPREDLETFGCKVTDLSGRCFDDNFRRLMEFEVARTREYYDRANGLFAYISPVGKPVLKTMIYIYRSLLDEIERCRYDVFTQRVHLSRWRKLFIAARVTARYKFQQAWDLIFRRAIHSEPSRTVVPKIEDH